MIELLMFALGGGGGFLFCFMIYGVYCSLNAQNKKLTEIETALKSITAIVGAHDSWLKGSDMQKDFDTDD